MPVLTPFATKLVGSAQDQFTTYHLMSEADPLLCTQTKKYWDDLNLGFTSCVSVPWSAVFVSWCVKQAGASGGEFRFAESHSVFVHEAIKNAINGTGVFQAVDVAGYAPNLGDIIQNNRNGHCYDYAFARANTGYQSHSAIVVALGQDHDNHYAITVGGNEGNAIRQTKVLLTPEGLIIQRDKDHNPYICVIKTLK
jgi:hypothetical protein